MTDTKNTNRDTTSEVAMRFRKALGIEETSRTRGWKRTIADVMGCDLATVYRHIEKNTWPTSWLIVLEMLEQTPRKYWPAVIKNNFTEKVAA